MQYSDNLQLYCFNLATDHSQMYHKIKTHKVYKPNATVLFIIDDTNG